ncbi:MAG: hypothetical protein EHM91_01850, partial [Planctomycetota bacterium]
MGAPHHRSGSAPLRGPAGEHAVAHPSPSPPPREAVRAGGTCGALPRPPGPGTGSRRARPVEGERLVTRVIESISGIQAYVVGCRKRGMKVGFVPTMGAFHDGHLTLMREARRNNQAVIVSIFVNPIQFSAGEDFDRYPRRLEQDTKMAESEGVDVIFCPSVAEMYPKGFDTFVDQSDLPGKLCGEFRVGHFRGVMTIVTKLFNMDPGDYKRFLNFLR